MLPLERILAVTQPNPESSEIPGSSPNTHAPRQPEEG
jgi:hypothetical protein